MKTSVNVESDATLLHVPPNASPEHMRYGFLDLMSRRDAKVVAFLGHAIEDEDTNLSIGLWFFDLDLVKKRSDPSETYVNWKRTYQVLPGKAVPELKEIAKNVAVPYAYNVDSIRGVPQFAFIGTRFVGPQFQSLWGIDVNSTDRVLIVPDGQRATDLFVAAHYAWPAFAKALSQGKTLGEAITDANTSCGNRCAANTITWHRIGGNDGMQLVPKK